MDVAHHALRRRVYGRGHLSVVCVILLNTVDTPDRHCVMGRERAQGNVLGVETGNESAKSRIHRFKKNLTVACTMRCPTDMLH